MLLRMDIEIKVPSLHVSMEGTDERLIINFWAVIQFFEMEILCTKVLRYDKQH